MDAIRTLIRDVPDFPKPGIVFKDLTPLLLDPTGLERVTTAMAEALAGKGIDRIAAPEARGFLFGATLAAKLGIGLIPIRKPGKLPWSTVSEEYALEYGTDTIEMHTDAAGPGNRVAIIDDVLATGGTAAATARLVASTGAVVTDALFVIELDFLKGREKLEGVAVHSLVHY